MYVHVLVDEHTMSQKCVVRLKCVDFTGLVVNEGMLGRAMEKTAPLKNVSLTQGDITKM